jgi:hypothetical protein
MDDLVAGRTGGRVLDQKLLAEKKLVGSEGGRAGEKEGCESMKCGARHGYLH